MTTTPTKTPTLALPATLPSGHIVASDISEDDYLEHYAEHSYEWVQGVLLKMSPVSAEHAAIVDYLRDMLRAYMELRPIGVVRTERFVQRLQWPDKRSLREPDLMVILDSNEHTLTNTYMDGPADICIEVVSLGTANIDYGDKLTEYEQGGVPEYWIIDPIRKQATFYHLQRLQGQVSPRYQRVDVAGDGYETPRLPGLKLHIPTLWRPTLPGMLQVGRQMVAMLGTDDA